MVPPSLLALPAVPGSPGSCPPSSGCFTPWPILPHHPFLLHLPSQLGQCPERPGHDPHTSLRSFQRPSLPDLSSPHQNPPDPGGMQWESAGLRHQPPKLSGQGAWWFLYPRSCSWACWSPGSWLPEGRPATRWSHPTPGLCVCVSFNRAPVSRPGWRGLCLLAFLTGLRTVSEREGADTLG